MRLIPDIETPFIETYGRVSATGISARFVQHSSSLGKWFNVYAFAIDEGPCAKVGVLFRDITAQKYSDEQHHYT